MEEGLVGMRNVMDEECWDGDDEQWMVNEREE